MSLFTLIAFYILICLFQEIFSSLLLHKLKTCSESYSFDKCCWPPRHQDLIALDHCIYNSTKKLELKGLAKRIRRGFKQFDLPKMTNIIFLCINIQHFKLYEILSRVFLN